jgi:hypothetical protein
MWAAIAGVAVILAQAAQPGGGAKDYEWCFDRDQGAQLCEETEAECNKLGVEQRDRPQLVQTGLPARSRGAAAEPGAADANATIAGGPPRDLLLEEIARRLRRG